MNSIPAEDQPYLNISISEKNVREFCKQYNENKQWGKDTMLRSAYQSALEPMARLFTAQLNKAMKLQEITPDNMPGFTTYVGSLAKLWGCSHRTVQNRLHHYIKCGVIIRSENQGANGKELWFHPDIIFKNQQGYAHFTGASQKTYTSDRTDPPIESSYRSTTATTNDTPIKKNFFLAESSLKTEKIRDLPLGESVKISPFSSWLEQINTNTTTVNKWISGNSKRIEGVPLEQNVEPVPSSVGKGIDPRTPPRTKESWPKKEIKQRKVAQSSAPKIDFSEPPTSEKQTYSGAERTFLKQRVKSFWDYAKKILYPSIILLEAEERIILNHIWASVFKKFPPGYSEDQWWGSYRSYCKRVDKVKAWLEVNPAFELPPPSWYFHPINNRGIAFWKTEKWLIQDERKALITKIKREVNEYAKGKGRYRNRSPLDLFRKHERMIAARKDIEISAMFTNLKGTLYGKLKMKEKFNN